MPVYTNGKRKATRPEARQDGNAISRPSDSESKAGARTEVEPVPSGSITGFRRDGSPHCLFENFLRTRQVNLIAGPTHSGKSIFLDHLIARWSMGETVFGKSPFPQSWWYYSMNKSSRLIMDLRYIYYSGRYTGVDGLPRGESASNGGGDGIVLKDLVEAANRAAERVFKAGRWEAGGGDPEHFAPVRVLFIEEINSLMAGDSNRDADVRGFMTGLTRECERLDVTVVGTVSSGKWRKNDRVLLAVERMKGSTDWASCAADVVHIEHENPTDETNLRRKIDLIPRRGKPERFSMTFTGTDAEHYSRIEIKRWYGRDAALDAKLAAMRKGSVVTFAMVQLWARESKVSSATAKRWLRGRVDEGTLKRLRHGVYALQKEVSLAGEAG